MYSGWNLDWEPTGSDVTVEDGINYAKFIDAFAKNLHLQGQTLSVDVATWSPIWNYTAISNTRVDQVISMGTYTSDDASYVNQLQLLVNAAGVRADVGLETVNATDGTAIPYDEVLFRFDKLQDAGVNFVALWRSPVPATFWEAIRSWVYPSSNEFLN